MAKAPRVEWTRTHELIALNLYFKLPFGKLDKGNRLIVDVAERMGRTPSSLAMKLSNLASLDPVQKARGIKGLAGASQFDKEMCAEFQNDMATLAPESEQLLHDLFTDDENAEIDLTHRDKIRIVEPKGPTERTATVKVRRGQHFFRQTVLNVYNVRCCISGINVPRLLVASHIKPWSRFPEARVSPNNGLCLSTLHDAAFDSGLITLDYECRVVLSKHIKSYLPQSSLEQNFIRFHGKQIEMPMKIAEPNREFLTYHREAIFLG